MKFVPLRTGCKACQSLNTDMVSIIPGYTGTILRSAWCVHCESPIVVRYQIVDETHTKVIEYPEVDIYKPKRPETGITIRPKASKRGNR